MIPTPNRLARRFGAPSRRSNIARPAWAPARPVWAGLRSGRRPRLCPERRSPRQGSTSTARAWDPGAFARPRHTPRSVPIAWSTRPRPGRSAPGRARRFGSGRPAQLPTSQDRFSPTSGPAAQHPAQGHVQSHRRAEGLAWASLEGENWVKCVLGLGILQPAGDVDVGVPGQRARREGQGDPRAKHRPATASHDPLGERVAVNGQFPPMVRTTSGASQGAMGDRRGDRPPPPPVARAPKSVKASDAQSASKPRLPPEK